MDVKTVTMTLSCVPASKPTKRGLLKPRSTTSIRPSTVDTNPKTTTIIVNTVTTRTFSTVVPGGTSYITITKTTAVETPPTSKQEFLLRADGTSTQKEKPSTALNDSLSSTITKTTTRTVEITILPSPATTVITEWITFQPTSTDSGIASELKTVTHTRMPSATITSQITFTSTKTIKTISTTSTTFTRTAENASTCQT
ncbi:hypothetical protein PEBR_39643 [Penicillium brasilianum]|uniref:Uncharacterized protein n=1 Tax=Penicillium brasilianum TaxID=104259 RepID=A0A1S9RB10_PENBI|nr:hypothetical protein PEBR_39643 [Penicillium brasilianum]